jgi:hypothetical protein
MGLSSSRLDREAIVLVRYFVRLKIVDPSGSISLGRLWAASEPISWAARRRIRAIENCVSRLLPSLDEPRRFTAASAADNMSGSMESEMRRYVTNSSYHHATVVTCRRS